MSGSQRWEGAGGIGRKMRDEGEGRAMRRREGCMYHISCAHGSYPLVFSPRLLVR